MTQRLHLFPQNLANMADKDIYETADKHRTRKSKRLQPYTGYRLLKISILCCGLITVCLLTDGCLRASRYCKLAGNFR